MAEIHYEGQYEGGYPLAQERVAVAKGAALLDKLLPGWHRQIRLNDLEMADGSMCMMGQLFGRGVEGELAKEMYPKEFEEAHDDWSVDNGYDAALYANGLAIIPRLMRKLKVKSDRKLTALKHVCSGHDNRCLWAEQIAERRAKEAQTIKAKRKAKRVKAA